LLSFSQVSLSLEANLASFKNDPDNSAPDLNFVRRGRGRPLLLVHGLGGTWKTWNPILDGLALEREVVAIDLPGFGDSPPLPADRTMRGLSNGLIRFVDQHNLRGIDAVGLSLGGRLLLEIARHSDVLGKVVALAPGGYRSGSHRHAFYVSMLGALFMIRLLQPAFPWLTSRPRGRALVLFAFCARPREVPAETALDELRGFIRAKSFGDILYDLTYRAQPALDALPCEKRGIFIGWGRQDRVCWPRHAHRALAMFPGATIHWFHAAGHFLHWDLADEVTRFILNATELNIETKAQPS
jgi:pimeloyl-ACP methyl ester carboxylesterase